MAEGQQPPQQPGAPARQPPASLVVYKRELRKAIAKNRIEPAIDFIQKPFSSSELAEKLARVLAAARGTGAS